MDTPTTERPPAARDWRGLVLVGGTVVLTLITAYIHSTLGGLMFTLTALGYLAFAIAMVIPLPLAARFRWLVRLGLLGFTLATIVGWVLIGARYDVAYLTKADEVLLVVFLAAGIVHFDGGPRGVLAKLLALPGELVGMVRGR